MSKNGRTLSPLFLLLSLFLIFPTFIKASGNEQCQVSLAHFYESYHVQKLPLAVLGHSLFDFVPSLKNDLSSFIQEKNEKELASIDEHSLFVRRYKEEYMDGDCEYALDFIKTNSKERVFSIHLDKDFKILAFLPQAISFVGDEKTKASALSALSSLSRKFSGLSFMASYLNLAKPPSIGPMKFYRRQRENEKEAMIRAVLSVEATKGFSIPLVTPNFSPDSLSVYRGELGIKKFNPASKVNAIKTVAGSILTAIGLYRKETGTGILMVLTRVSDLEDSFKIINNRLSLMGEEFLDNERGIWEVAIVTNEPESIMKYKVFEVYRFLKRYPDYFSLAYEELYIGEISNLYLDLKKGDFSYIKLDSKLKDERPIPMQMDRSPLMPALGSD